MGIFKRIRDISMGTINELIDKAEDPVVLLNQYLRDMEKEIADAEIAVAKQIAIEKRFKQQYEEAKELVGKRADQALKALEAGNEDLARRALEDKKGQQEKADEFLTQYENAKSNADQLRSQLQEMKEEFQKLKNKKDTLVARAETAKAQKQLNQMVSGIGTENAAKGFERMSEKVLQLEAEAQAAHELSQAKRSLDEELSALEKSDVEEELAALKAQLAEKNKATEEM